MDIEVFNYNLPMELIAQYPSKKRDHSRMLVLNKTKNTIEDHYFYNILDFLRPGDVLVRNNSRVIPARLFGLKEGTGAKVEVLLLHLVDKDTYECLVGNAKVIKKGTVVNFSSELKATCVEVKDEGLRHLKFSYEGIFIEVLERVGLTPLPPYIKDDKDKYSHYQTVYAKVNGSAAAPTAGFHFTNELIEKIKEKKVEILDITLHVGLGTFRPVSVKKTEDHIMHEEYYMIDEIIANKLNEAKKKNRRIIAVGTTTVRVLESSFAKFGRFLQENSSTKLFITPGYKFKAIDALITNFHLPKSTLLMLVSAFSGLDFTMEAYKHAIEEKYRFFSFGDAMFIYED